MTVYKFGDVVLVPFPFTDQTTTKKRPAVVVSSDLFNSQYADLIVMAITSKSVTGTVVGEVAIADWSDAGLLKPSIIKPVVATIEKGLVIRKLGELQESDREELEKVLPDIFG
jgi:mRNA interferase MazF